MTEESNQEEEIIDDIYDETDDIKPTEGEDTDEESLTPSELSKYNERTGKNYKSLTWKEIANKEKIVDEAYRTKKVEAKEEKKVVNRNESNEEITEELLLVKNPEAETVLDDVKSVADAKYGGNRVKAYREETWLQEKAKIEMQKEENIKKIKSPSSNVRHVEPSVKVTDEDKRIADKYFGGDIARYLKVKSN